MRPPNPLAPSSPAVWAVEDTSLQVTWGNLPAGPVTVWAHDAHTIVDHGGGPGSADLRGLAADADHRVELTHAEGRVVLPTRTLPAPPGEELCRVATISDLHLGATNWGASKLMVDRSGDTTPFPYRCARAAIAEAIAWGAELLVVKGDAAHHQDSDHFTQLGDLLDEFDDLPVLLIPGNHDVDQRGDGPTLAKVGKRGVPYIRGAACEDLQGLRVIVADTTIPGQGPGTVDRVGDEVIELASVGAGPYLLGIHHQLQPYSVPTHYPIGIKAPGSVRFLDALAAANARGLVTSGHTHRNRTRRHGPLVVTEVAATRDWPGVWAGYVVHEGGIRQVVRRAAAANAVTWHEYSRRALLGLWGWWAAGPQRHRCFTHRWPRR